VPSPLDAVASALGERFEVERELGRGGASTVYAGRDRTTGRPVAIKVLRPELAVAIQATRFRNEIALLAELNHPNVLPLIATEESGKLVYYAMPLAEGGSLRDRLDAVRQLPLGDTIAVTRDVAAALDYAHGRNVLHRDIKPENIVFVEGRVMLCDFGVARALVRAGGERLSSTGLVIGTPSYMSPEQARGESELDGRTDVYSLACVTYEMLIGEPPFTGPNPQTVMARQLKAPPPSLRVVRPDVSEKTERAIHRALAKKPKDRPRTAGEFVQGLGPP
jgi:serine/threonine-protein kinase